MVSWFLEAWHQLISSDIEQMACWDGEDDGVTMKGSLLWVVRSWSEVKEKLRSN